MFRLLRGGGAAPGLTVSVLHEMAELERLRDAWEQLLGHSAGLHPSLTPTWLLTWWRVFGPEGGRRMHALAVHRGRALVGLLPLLGRRRWHYRVVPLRRLEMLATGEEQADEILSEYLGPLVASGQEEEVIGAMADHLAANRRVWEEIAFSALDGRSPAVHWLAPAFRARGFACESRPFGECPYIALPARWEDYLAALSADDRYMVKRSLRDFDRWAGKESRFEVARGYADLQRGKAILHRLHEGRWQARGQAGVFASPTFRRFHDLLMPALLGRGELDLRWLLVRGEPVAVSYGIVNENRVFFYQGGRATDVPKGVRPGIVLHLHAIRAAIEARRLEYDFLSGDARYKLQLATRSRALMDLRVSRPSLPEAARTAVGAARALLVEARAWARAELPPRRKPPGVAPEPAPPAPRPETSPLLPLSLKGEGEERRADKPAGGATSRPAPSSAARP